MLQTKERKGKEKKGKGGTERKEREGREGKETGRKVKRKEKKGTTAIWSDIVCNIGWNCYLALQTENSCWLTARLALFSQLIFGLEEY